ncbi:MAG: response regulator [Desulfuromonadaceae bacterium]|nr:response regulator [Desulfuromonadaceae bacterium]
MRSSLRHFFPAGMVIAIIMACALIPIAASPLYAVVSVPRILVINSYNTDYDWSEAEMEGVHDALAKAYQRTEMYIEYLDTKKFHTKKHFPRLADLLEAKYAGRHLDAIIAMDNAALEFASLYRQRISPGTPLIFCGINDYEPAMIAGQSRITGVAQYLDSAGTLGLALQLHPAVRNVVVIHDYTDTGLAIRHELEKTASRYAGVKLEFLDEMPLERAVEKLKGLPADYLVLMLSYTVEKNGRTFGQSEAARLVSNAAPVPVYAVHAAQLGTGVVGGLMMEGLVQGRKAAELAVRIIGGESAEKLPVITGELSRPMFDYRVLEKFGISPANLPDDAVLINKPPSTVAINKTAVWLGGAFTLLCTTGLLVLVLNIRKRRRLEEMLRLKIDQYQESQEELKTIEEMLRTQVDEYMQSQDDLLATEEMLRVQLEAVEESSQKFKAVFEQSPIAVALTSLPEGTFCEVNQAFKEMFNYPGEETLGKTTVELGIWLHESDRDRYLRLLRENGCVNNVEVRARRKGGEELDIIVSAAMLKIGGRSFVLSTIMDMTGQKRLQAQLFQSQKMDVVGQLAGGVAHDFNNMLAVIMAVAELLKRRLSGDEKNNKMVDTIIEAATRSAGLTRELLNFTSKRTSASTPVHINDTITAVMSLLERTIDKQIKLTTRLESGTPFVMGDQTQLQNALLNLGVNARDAMPQGGTLTYATTGVELDEAACRLRGISLAPGRYLEIAVSDSGTGMTKAVMEHVFEPFFTTKEVGKGTGLGLAAVYGTVRSHRGEICVQSEPGVGSVFKIYLPMMEGGMLPPRSDTDVVSGKGGVLLVDDEEILRDVGRELLEDLGYTVYLAENGVQALDVFAAHRGEISLVMLDMNMPEMGGKDAFLLLREQDPELKVLFCSGFSREGTGDELVGMGASGFIQKPYNRGELSRAVAEALGL